MAASGLVSASRPVDHLVPLAKIRQTCIATAGDPRPKLVLISCGSFSPITFLHLRIMENARDHLMQQCRKYNVVGGLFSPVHDLYKKPGLAPSADRLRMCQLAVESSEWLDVAAWEISEPVWHRTADVLLYYSSVIRDQLGAAAGGDIQLRLVCGSDLLELIPKPDIWSPPHVEVLLKRFGLVVLQREGVDGLRTVFASDLLYAARLARSG